MKRAFIIFSLVLAGIVAGLWVRVLMGNHRHLIEIPPSGNHRDYIEGRKQTPFHLLVLSDRRGMVFDVFIRQLPPQRAPGPPGSDETRRWLKLHAEHMAAVNARFLGFEKGIEYRHGQFLNDALYFYGIDYYFAVPHVVLIVLGAFPCLCQMRRHRIRARQATALPGAAGKDGDAPGLAIERRLPALPEPSVGQNNV